MTQTITDPLVGINLNIDVTSTVLKVRVGLGHFKLNHLPVVKINYTAHSIHHELGNVVNVWAGGATNHLFSPILEPIKRADTTTTTFEVALGAPHLAIQPNNDRDTFGVNKILFPEHFGPPLEESCFVFIQFLLGWVVEPLELSVSWPPHGFGLARQTTITAVTRVFIR